jgi:serine/threonine protein kinase
MLPCFPRQGRRNLPLPTTAGPYEFLQVIGQGTFSVILLARHQTTNVLTACKVCSVEFLNDNKLLSRFEQEVRIHTQLFHPNLVNAIDVHRDSDFVFFFMEYCPGGDLFRMLATSGRLAMPSLRIRFAQIVDVMLYLHSQNIAHRDLKPENILLDGDGNLKLSDFGLSAIVTSDSLSTTPCGSLYYTAPEILSGRPYDGKCADIWSLGVLLFCMAVGSLPWTSTGQSEVSAEIRSGRVPQPAEMPDVVYFLVTQMMAADSRARPTVEELADCEWVGGQERRLQKGQGTGSLDFAARAPRMWNVAAKSQVTTSVPRAVSLRVPVVTKPVVRPTQPWAGKR